ncbi:MULTISPECIES: hypothetical protein [Vibrio]|uniref:C-type lysozyme inhibitor domain-containing protein n=1 Tax=Vibrio parahaemolyticus TaxID=670 RepID=A0A9Q3UDM1_VIBPH|nr:MULTISPECIES: hypothetical protein [Vibrio]EGQ8109711.1 hypothetical protein [Vibrio parahaemolyticus]EGQ8546834.1 hypothetical protein [Vibrio parahaemolyticus]EGQ9070632.1 hypothetical protein [Vibrio parahaemolyticus]EGQ9132865.1 hypothetical protein [Vibrio parahaemolyticus]EGR3388472.1 hypothetical protein [Vibrio parahaemolyticus]
MKSAIILLFSLISSYAFGVEFDKTQTSYECGDHRVQIMSDRVVFIKFPNKPAQDEFVVEGQFRNSPIINVSTEANWGEKGSKWFFSLHRYDTPTLSGAWLRPDIGIDEWSLLSAFSSDCRIL